MNQFGEPLLADTVFTRNHDAPVEARSELGFLPELQGRGTRPD